MEFSEQKRNYDRSRKIIGDLELKLKEANLKELSLIKQIEFRDRRIEELEADAKEREGLLGMTQNDLHSTIAQLERSVSRNERLHTVVTQLSSDLAATKTCKDLKEELLEILKKSTNSKQTRAVRGNVND